ncbi:hypothetical protein RF11_11623 [Thelohanellus kitauei]|uniref:Tc1-like transposase DDE domain-containing protein n=1 Tax=Thelohanellus kitauei TaxID=669202 RepID=A0A0C2MJT3_THEKT|nr:hypothetical protein RF11_11623 [Thelohanellus kitauei]
MEYVRWYNSHTRLVRYRNVIFIDESPFSLHMLKIHSWAVRGVTPNPIIRHRLKNVTMILAKNAAGIINSEALMTGANGTVFHSFIEECARILGEDENYILVMVNVRFHHTINLEGRENSSVRYLPA